MSTHAAVQKRQHEESDSQNTGQGKKLSQAAGVGLPLFMQAKLSIGASDDPLELEADRVADQVLAAPSHSTTGNAPMRIQPFSGSPSIETNTVPTSVERVLADAGTALEPALRQDMEQRFGHDFSAVRVHSNTLAEGSARDVSARAYTVGRDIVFGAERFEPGTQAGRRLLAHELTHVVQQSGTDGIRASQGNEKHGLSPIILPLPSGVRSAMEACFGEALDDVRLHDGPAAHRSADSLGARAYTTGSDIVLGDQVSMAEVNDPRSQLLTHELTHVLQHRRAGKQGITDRIAPSGGDAEREAERNSWLNTHGLPVDRVRTAAEAVALTPTSSSVEYDLSYAANDWAVTAAEERRILDALDRDSDLSATITDLKAAGMLDALLDRVDEPANRRRLLHILGRGLNAAALALVEPYVRRLGTGAELQFNLGRFGVTSGAPAFNPAALEAAVVGTARTSRTGHSGGHLTDPFTGVGATGVIPVTRYVGTFYRTPGVPQIPLGDQALLAAGHAGTVTTYSNPLTGLSTYLGGLSGTQRTQQAELLLRRPIASVEAASYGGNLPSRAQVIKAASGAHNLHGSLLAAFILAEQRDQTQAEDAKDYQGATSLLQGNTSIGLGQVVVSTARRQDLFADLVTTPTRTARGLNKTSGPGQHATAGLLASDEYNIFAAARYIRQVANQGSTLSLAALPNTAATYPGIILSAYAGNSITWPDDNIRALGSEYTSTAWDDSLRPAWGEFVYQAYLDVRATGLV